MSVHAPPATEEVEYPCSDGKPMAESDLHRDQMIRAIGILEELFAGRDDVYVSGNLLVYYERGNPRRCRAPDAFVVFGVPKKKRDVYKTWEEGRFPDFVLEVTSRTTRSEDADEQYLIYRDAWKVREYFLFDPLEEYLDPSLQGYRLVGGEYVPIPSEGGQLTSEVLGVRLDREGMRLVFRDPTLGRVILPLAEERARAAELAREMAVTKARFAEDARSLAAMERDAERQARQAAEKRLQEARQENDELRAEIDALRKQQPPA